MSGIAGSWVVHRVPSADELWATAERLVQSLSHRGRQSHRWAGQKAAPALAAVSTGKGEPRVATSADGRYVVVASDVGGPQEAVARMIVAELAASSIMTCLQQLTQPVSVAIWDGLEQTLTLSRDRMGQTDLYYTCNGFGLTFSSELKTLSDERVGAQAVDAGALAQLFQLGYIPSPLTAYQGVFKLPAGSCRTFTLADVRQWQPAHAAPGPFVLHWDLREEAERRIARQQHGTLTDSVEAVIASLDHAIARTADHRSAALLSGGVDSSLIVALLQRQRTAPVETLSVGFEDPGHDESEWAAQVAAHLGARNTRVVIGDADALRLVEKAARVFSEPYADSSALPALLAAEAGGAFSSVLTGDGGDELFFGHGAYAKSLRNHALVRHVPGWLRQASRRHMSRAPESARLGGLAAILSEAQCASLAEIYLMRASRWREPASVVKRAVRTAPPLLDATRHLRTGHPGELLLLLDQGHELPDGLFTKSDRAFGAHGLGVGHPFVDPEVLDLAWRTPFEHKFCKGETKVVLKRALDRYLPAHHSRRPKKGFGAPVGRWLRGPLRDWAEDLLDPIAIRDRGLLNEDVVSGVWTSFLEGNRKFHTHLWPILMFLAWDREWNGHRAGMGAGWSYQAEAA